MLQSLNCAVDVVGDGVEAVAAAKRQAYDLIFLDCQMPNLDGYGAARQLRQLEADGAIPRNRTAWPSRLPIVALTAHTAPADRQQSFDSGMDDYASKPFALKTLQEVLGRWIRPHAAEDAEPAGGGAAAEPDGPEAGMLQQGSPLNEKTLHELRALGDKTGGGLCARVLRSYLETASKTLTQLHEAAAAHDAASMARAAHDLKSTSQNVGAERLAMLSLRLERVAKADTTKGSDALIAEIDQLFADVKEALEERLANGDAGAEAVA